MTILLRDMIKLFVTNDFVRWANDLHGEDSCNCSWGAWPLQSFELLWPYLMNNNYLLVQWPWSILPLWPTFYKRLILSINALFGHYLLCWLVSWLVGWLAGWLVGWLVDSLPPPPSMTLILRRIYISKRYQHCLKFQGLTSLLDIIIDNSFPSKPPPPHQVTDCWFIWLIIFDHRK